MSEDQEELRTSIRRLSKDLIEASRTLTVEEARYLVDAYYIYQGDRKRYRAQEGAMKVEPHSTLVWLADQSHILEAQLKRALQSFAEARPIGEWMLSLHGVGPVIAAGMLCHIELDQAPTVGHVWRFAGLDPTVKWGKGEKRPWNDRFKVLCWNAGQVFMRTSGSDKSFYGPIYQERKAYEVKRNESGENAEKAAELVKHFDKKTEAYKHLKSGKLPPAQIDARARRYAVKLFLSHIHTVWWWLDKGELPAKPYILTKEHHGRLIVPPNIEPDLVQALKAWRG